MYNKKSVLKIGIVLFLILISILFITNIFAESVDKTLEQTQLEEELADLKQQLVELGYNPEEVFNITSIFVSNYSCNESGNFTTKVLTEDEHTLEFEFGPCGLGQVDKAGSGCIIAYAHNIVKEKEEVEVIGEWMPAGLQKWQNADDKNKFKAQIGGAIANYQKESGKWAQIKNDWRVEGDKIICDTGVLKTEVSKDGESIINLEWDGETYQVKQKLIDLVLLNTKTKKSSKIDNKDINFSEPEIIDNKIIWRDVVDGVDVEIIKENGQVFYRLVYEPEFISKAVNAHKLSSEPENIVLGNVMEFELINIDNTDFEGDTYERVLKKFNAIEGRGNYEFKISRQELQYEGSNMLGPEDEPSPFIVQNWKKKDGKIYLTEQVEMNKVKEIYQKNPNKKISHNDVTVIGSANIEDSYFWNLLPSNNYGTSTTFRIIEDYTTRAPIRVLDVATALGASATISACTLSCYTVVDAGTDFTLSAYRIFKPWTEAGVTFFDWVTPNSEWGASGCNSADDGGSDNSGDGTGADRKATAEDSVAVSAVNTWYNLSITTALAQGWYDGTINEEGILLKGDTSSFDFASTEYTTDTSKRPYFTFEYSTAPPNTVPTNPSPEINSTLATNLTSQDLNCFDTIIDPDGDSLNVTIKWYNNSIEHLLVDYNNSYANNSFFNAVLNSGNTTVGDSWNCSMRLFDGTDYSSWVNSSSLTILNAQPDAPSPIINSTLGTNLTTEDLHCSFTPTDDDSGETLFANITWLRNNITNFTLPSLSVTQDDLYVSDLESENTSMGDLWSCEVQVCDDGSDCSSWVNSSQLEVNYGLNDCTTLNTAGQYQLTANIENSAYTHCINITASNVELDCQGHLIDGVGGSTYGIFSDGASGSELTNITIKDCVLTEWGTGVYFDYTDQSLVENVNTTSNSDGLTIYYSDNNQFINVNSSENTDDGVYLRGHYNNLSNLFVSSNGDDGFYIYLQANYNTIKNSTIIYQDGPNDNGLYVYAHSNQFLNNTIAYNDYGVYIFSVYYNNFSDNRITGNTQYGVQLIATGSDNNYFWNNIINNTNNYGITSGQNNFWNTTKQPGTNIITGNFLGGNFWSNYTTGGFSDICPNYDGDGICDESYTLYTDGAPTINIDYLPLTYNDDDVPDDPTVLINSTDGSNATFSDLNAWFTPSDNNSDVDNCEVIWLKNNITNLTFNDLSCSNGTLFVNVLDKNNLTDGETWRAEVKVEDSNGYNSSWANSSEILIETILPQLDYVTINTRNETNYRNFIVSRTNNTLYCYNGSISVGYGNVNLRYKWYKNNVEIDGETSQSLSGDNFIREDIIFCSIQTYDGYGLNTSWINSTGRRIIDTTRGDFNNGTNSYTNNTIQSGNISLNYNSNNLEDTLLFLHFDDNYSADGYNETYDEGIYDNDFYCLEQGGSCPTFNSTGYINGAFEFGGTDYFKINSNPELSFSAGDNFTLSFWAKSKAIGASRIMYTYDNDGWAIFADNAGSGFYFGTWSSTNSKSIFCSRASNQWYYVVGVRDQGTQQMELWIDGEKCNNITEGIRSIYSTDPIYIGTDKSKRLNYTGALDELRIWNRSLTGEEIVRNYQRGLEKIQETLNNYEFNGTFTSDIFDLGKNNNMSEISWGNNSVANQSLFFQTRMGTCYNCSGINRVPDSVEIDWGNWVNSTGGDGYYINGEFINNTYNGTDARYLQYKAFFNSTNTNTSMVLTDVALKQNNYTVRIFNEAPYNNFSLLFPYDGEIIIDTTPSFNITKYSDLDGLTNVLWDFEIYNDSELTELNREYYNLTLDNYTLTSALTQNTYYWRARLFDNITIYDEVYETRYSDWSSSFSFTINSAPDAPSPIINSTLGTNLTTEDLHCSFTPTDDDSGETLFANITWLKNNVTNFTLPSLSVTQDSLYVNSLEAANTSINDLWSCEVEICDDSSACSGWVNSSQLKILSTNTAPNDPTNLMINSTSTAHTNYTTEDLAMHFYCDDPDDSDTLTYHLMAYKDGVADFMLESSCSDPEYKRVLLNNANTSKTEVWSFSVNVSDDDGEFSGTVSTVINVTIINSIPSQVTLNDPVSGNITTDRTPTLKWNEASDDDSGDSLTYDIFIECEPACSVDDRTITGQSGDCSGGVCSYTLTSELNYFWDDNDFYNWSVRAYDSEEYGINSTEWNISIQSEVTLTLPNSTIAFGTKTLGDKDNTTDGVPGPFLVQNDGNCVVDVNISALTWLWATKQSASSYFQYKVDEYTPESNSFDVGESTTTWTDIPNVNNSFIKWLNYSDTNDMAEVDILIEVPLDEPKGDKESSIGITGYYVKVT